MAKAIQAKNVFFCLASSGTVLSQDRGNSSSPRHTQRYQFTSRRERERERERHARYSAISRQTRGALRVGGLLEATPMLTATPSGAQRMGAHTMSQLTLWDR